MSGETRAIIFDLDDTLYLERDYALSGYRAVAVEHSAKLGPAEKAAQRMGELFDSPNRSRVFDALLEAAGLGPDRELAAAMLETYRRHRPSIALCADADRALARLRAAGVRLGLISDGRLEGQKLKVDALGLLARLDAIVLTAELGPGFGKPHPAAFERIAAQPGIAAMDCTYVADNPAKDFVAPNRLGWKTIQIVRPGGLYAGNPPAAGGAAQRVIATLDELA